MGGTSLPFDHTGSGDGVLPMVLVLRRRYGRLVGYSDEEARSGFPVGWLATHVDEVLASEWSHSRPFDLFR
jgi:hypothetical protein